MSYTPPSKLSPTAKFHSPLLNGTVNNVSLSHNEISPLGSKPSTPVTTNLIVPLEPYVVLTTSVIEILVISGLIVKLNVCESIFAVDS